MRIDSIRNGIVIDHITAGKAMELYRMLRLEELDCPVAVIKNAVSQKQGKKDIIKIDSSIEIDLDVIGYISPNATVCIIRDGVVQEKRHLALPKRLTGILHCKNPRCITTTEQGIKQVFVLSETDHASYRCLYCDARP
ncbi:MAG: aspartate carbamoyltransferase regulatory subunit [Oscillospiraceae bacterium]|nr:aspartate carbamoyltransferase regulatory subunit [Oscillospiraceae bacterium]